LSDQEFFKSTNFTADTLDLSFAKIALYVSTESYICFEKYSQLLHVKMLYFQKHKKYTHTYKLREC